MTNRGNVWVGTSGWMYKHWRERFYPASIKTDQWFEYYSRHFHTVEINNSFYHLPPESTYRLWKRKAPLGFLYAVKANRLLTHRKKLNNADEILPRILEPAFVLGDRLGPVLYQLPPHWHVNVPRLRSFLKLLPKDVFHSVEFRDSSWYVPAVREALDEFNVGFCIHDLRAVRTPDWVTGPLAYVRFHGPTTTAYAGRYGKPRLRHYAEMMREWTNSGHEVFAYFNNDGEAAAIHDAKSLLELLG